MRIIRNIFDYLHYIVERQIISSVYILLKRHKFNSKIIVMRRRYIHIQEQ